MAAFAALSFCLSGCGYTLQTSSSPLREQYGIEKIYVEPIVNNSYKPGVENIVYNELLRTLNGGRRVQIVRNEKDADAILRGSVSGADSVPGASIPANRLKPVESGPSNVFVAIEYMATLSCEFKLLRAVDGKPGKMIWNSGFSRSHAYPGNNQLGVAGATSQLINESEFDRVLGDLARMMMDELHESMLAMF